MTTPVSRIAVVLLLGIPVFVGCGKDAAPPIKNETNNGNTAELVDPDDIPLTNAQIDDLKASITSYEDALARIKSYREAIANAIATDDPHQAHRPLDELDVVLEHVPTVARDSDIPRSNWETVNTCAQEIRRLFNLVHAQIDAGEEPDYEAVSEKIEAAITDLQNAQPTG